MSPPCNDSQSHRNAADKLAKYSPLIDEFATSLAKLNAVRSQLQNLLDESPAPQPEEKHNSSQPRKSSDLAIDTHDSPRTWTPLDPEQNPFENAKPVRYKGRRHHHTSSQINLGVPEVVAKHRFSPTSVDSLDTNASSVVQATLPVELAQNQVQKGGNPLVKSPRFRGRKLFDWERILADRQKEQCRHAVTDKLRSAFRANVDLRQVFRDLDSAEQNHRVSLRDVRKSMENHGLQLSDGEFNEFSNLLDDRRSGKVSYTQFSNIVQGFQNAVGPLAEWSQDFGAGQKPIRLEKGEQMIDVVRRKIGEKSSQLKRIFRNFDKGYSNRLSAIEIRQGLHNVGVTMSDGQFTNFMDTLHRDAGGNVSLADFAHTLNSIKASNASAQPNPNRAFRSHYHTNWTEAQDDEGKPQPEKSEIPIVRARRRGRFCTTSQDYGAHAVTRYGKTDRHTLRRKAHAKEDRSAWLYNQPPPQFTPRQFKQVKILRLSHGPPPSPYRSK